MKRKFLEDMGLTKEQVDNILNENGQDVEAAKGDLNQIKVELKQAQDQVKERDGQLEEIKKSGGDNETLKKQIEDLQEENARVKLEKDGEIKELKMNSAIKSALGESTQDSELVTGLFDRDKLILGDDGKVTGLEEQLKSLKESKPFLFKTEETPKPGIRHLGAPSNPSQPIETKDGKIDMKAAIEAHLQPQISK